MDFAGFYNGRPCKACVSVEDMMKMGKDMASKKAGGGGGSSSKQGQAGSSTATDANNNETRRKDCPVDKDELGRSTWNLLHTMAAYYPDKPTPVEKDDMKSTLTSLSKTYPCPHCAEDFRKDIKEHPPRLENRETLSKWMCEMHNRVNTKLGKDTFDCTKVFERWYDGWKDGSCGY
ncbi:Protein F56C11.3 [Aphelenchoides avenae]|nr:Protein F56C11.3 [Aphelenchus avenae]